MDRDAYVMRVRACERRLYRVARTLLRADADCEDAVQEALLRAWAKLDTLRRPEYFETWLIRILINVCRSGYRRPAAEALPDDLPAQDDGGDARVLSALSALPEKPRIALELHCVEGYDVKACARMLGVPEGTVKWRLSRGRALLRRELGEEEL